MAGFPEPRPDVLYLTEGGQETELMYQHGHDLREFALYPLLDDPAAMADLADMYTRYLEVAATYGFVPLMGGLDYRASPYWAARLGISPDALVDLQLRSIELLRDLARPFAPRLPEVLIAGIVGPRNDAYEGDRTITAAESEAYHAVQLAALRKADVDLVSALTVNNVPEAVGLARAAQHEGLPLAVSFMVDGGGRLLTGPMLLEAIDAVDSQAGDARPDFYGVNCSHPTELVAALDDSPLLARIRSLRPNASVAEKQALCEIGHLEAGDPEELAGQVEELVRRLPNLDIIGGCCGTWDRHLRAMAERLRRAKP